MLLYLNYKQIEHAKCGLMFKENGPETNIKIFLGLNPNFIFSKGGGI